MNDHLLTHGYEFHESSTPTASALGYPEESINVYAMTGESRGTQFGSHDERILAETPDSVVFNLSHHR
jgi:hypothetical protein